MLQSTYSPFKISSLPEGNNHILTCFVSSDALLETMVWTSLGGTTTFLGRGKNHWKNVSESVGYCSEVSVIRLNVWPMTWPCRRLSLSSCKVFQKFREVRACCASHMGNTRGLSRNIWTICPFCLYFYLWGRDLFSILGTMLYVPMHNVTHHMFQQWCDSQWD